MATERRQVLAIAARVGAVLCAVAAAALAVYTVLLVYAALTYDSEGAPGPLVLYMVAVGTALATVLCAGLAHVLWRAASRA